MRIDKISLPADDSSAAMLELRRRVSARFKDSGRSDKANLSMVARTIAMLGLAVAAYGLILSNRFSPVPMLALAALVGVAVAGIGFGVSHDALHGAYSSRPWVNRLLGLTFDLCGASSYMWKLGHNVVHHTYTNIPGTDGDVAGSSLLRQSPVSERRPCHRYQHIYAFALYSLATLNWVFIKDYKDVFEKHWSPERDKVHPPRQIASMLAMKGLYYSWSIVLPLIFVKVPWWQFLIGFLTMHVTAGLILGIVFQLAHIVEEVSFPTPTDGQMPSGWLAHELATTANFANGNRLLTWFVGGLNHQIEHHLFPRICSVHYPEIREMVREIARSHGLPYYHQPTVWQAVRSHYRLLRALGASEPCASIMEIAA